MYEKEVIQLPQDFPFLTFATDARQMVMHQHDCLEINRILSGSGTYWIEEKQYEILPGDIFIINNQEQHMAVHDGSLLMQVFLFDPAFIWEGPSGWHFLEPFYHFSNRIREVGLYQDLDRIVKEAKGKEEGWQLMVSSLLLVFLAELRRYHKQYQEAGKDVHTSYQRIRPVLSYMQQHLDEPGVSGAAGRAGGAASPLSVYLLQRSAGAHHIGILEAIADSQGLYASRVHR